MTDLEMTKLCAEAMDLDLGSDWNQGTHVMLGGHGGRTMEMYDPLHDDAQAMALVKRFGLRVEKSGDCWSVCKDHGFERAPEQGWDESLNRAIVECVAKMRAANL